LGGGVILLVLAIAMLHARPSRLSRAEEEVDEAARQAGIAVVPLGIPVAAGPGAISAALIYGERAKNWADEAIVLIIIGLVVLCFWIALRMAGPTKRILGTTGINVVTRLLGLILIAVAVEFIARGALELFPGNLFGVIDGSG
jgi:multiple antibiotic resistance protein